MSIQSTFLNFILKKYIKNQHPPVEERSYLEVRKLMNQDGYVDKPNNFIEKYLQTVIFGKKKSNLSIKELYLENIRCLYFNHKNFDESRCILYFHGGGYVAGSPETHENFLVSLAEKSKIAHTKDCNFREISESGDNIFSFRMNTFNPVLNLNTVAPGS